MSPTLDAQRFYGEFSLQPQITLGELANAYGFDLGQLAPDQTIEQYLESKMHGKPVLGDQVPLGPVSLIIREIAQNRIVSIGLILHTSKRKK